MAFKKAPKKASVHYLQRFAEAEARELQPIRDVPRWRHVLVVPAYRESPSFVQTLRSHAHVLVILVLNRPDSDPDSRCNDSLRDAVRSLPRAVEAIHSHAGLYVLGQQSHILLVERPDALPAKEGVGLARKLGADLALALINGGWVSSPWIHCSDADAALPDHYFSVARSFAGAAALTYPFRHVQPNNPKQWHAIQIYERFLAHYVEGLRAADSPYAFHTLGSCIACDAGAYATVRGFPRRSGGEDFYLLNKLAKTGRVATPNVAPLQLSARLSDRVPFGTGPALRKLLTTSHPSNVALFYHPECFSALDRILSTVKAIDHANSDHAAVFSALRDAPAVSRVMTDLGLARFLEHASRQCADQRAWLTQFHQWFDGFRTLKFIRAMSTLHGLRTLNAGGTETSLAAIARGAP